MCEPNYVVKSNPRFYTRGYVQRKPSKENFWFWCFPTSGDNVYYGVLSENFEIQYPGMNWGELSFIVIGTTILLIVEWKHIHLVLHLYIHNGDYSFTIHISIITLEADQLWYSPKSGLYNRVDRGSNLVRQELWSNGYGWENDRSVPETKKQNNMRLCWWKQRIN